MILKERTMTDLENREAFKAWFKKEYLGIDILANQGDEGAITRRGYAYVGWQASTNREGYKLVPVEPSEDMIMAGCMEHGGYDVIDSKSIYKAMLEVV